MIDLLNKKTYSKAKVLDYYAGLEKLFPAEEVLFEKLAPKLSNAKILDIGVGGGRTTKYLLPRSREYTGIDYIPEFIDLVKDKYKEGTFLCGDARNLGGFDDETFDFVLFSYNGIDAVVHDDRIKILAEIYRVLKPGATVMFSSHNRRYRHFKKPYWLTELRFSPSLIKNMLSHAFFYLRHLLMKKHEVDNDSYAIVNDSDHRFSLLIYYICIRKQIEQLHKIGFRDVGAYNSDGELVSEDTESFWVYYLARK
ncbi:MAG: class I SAM-dependent methyltransferase [Pyrinomonadaceae bacterium]